MLYHVVRPAFARPGDEAWREVSGFEPQAEAFTYVLPPAFAGQFAVRGDEVWKDDPALTD